MSLKDATMPKMLTLSSLVIFSSIALTACSSAPSSSTYPRAQAGKIHQVTMGTVTGIRKVLIEKDHTDVGTSTGVALGGIAGSTAGEGRGKAAASVVGAVVGGIIGSNIDKRVQTQPGYEITVRLQSGKTVAVTQLADEAFNIGDQVKVLENNGLARVTH
jgi:outer membrane lipoprotein SlyB